ncbi:MAG: efflux RND transporter periplasmic adaptor subunit, partial [Nevskiales bacterium]
QSGPAPAPVVQVTTVKQRNYQVEVASRGTVQAHTQVALVAQVSGEIVDINPDFRDGGYFGAGETLIKIDPRDYQLAVTMAEAELASAQQRLSEEKARSAQAERDWERLGGGGAPNDLALRKPQLAGAKAALAAAEASLAQARLNLKRTEVSLPYDGRVLSKSADVGQVVTAGTRLGEVYSTDKAEVRLPLSNRQLAKLSIPEQYRGEDAQPGPEVTLSAQVGDRVYSWLGRVVRSSGAIDANSRQSFVVAQVDDPYGRREDGGPPLKVGQFVEARIQGEQLNRVFVIPRSALRGENLAYVIKKTGDQTQLDERRVGVVWQDDNAVVIRDGLKAGEQLVTTLPSAAAPGMRVRLPEARPATPTQAPKQAAKPQVTDS